MFLVSFKPTSPARRWSKSINGTVITSMLSRRLRSKYLGYQGETKKVKRSRVIGPSQVLVSNNPLDQRFAGLKTIIGTVKSARTAHISTVLRSLDGVVQYNRAFQGAAYGNVIYDRNLKHYNYVPALAGHMHILVKVEPGTMVYSVNTWTSKVVKLATAPGTFCKVLWHHMATGLTAVRLPSKLFVKLNSDILVWIGRNANAAVRFMVWGNARATRKRYKKAISVRGVAKNPVDHPNGGRANTKQPLKNPWGKIAKCGK